MFIIVMIIITTIITIAYHESLPLLFELSSLFQVEMLFGATLLSDTL